MLKIEHLGFNYGPSIYTAIQSLAARIKSQKQETYFHYLLACQKYLEANGVIKVVSKSRVPWSSVISHYENGTIFYNPRKYRLMREWEIAGNLAHEALHHLKYTHSFEWNSERKWSEAYFIGYWVEFYLSKLKLGVKPDFNEFIIEMNRRK